jgi:hypothetical protein
MIINRPQWQLSLIESDNRISAELVVFDEQIFSNILAAIQRDWQQVVQDSYTAERRNFNTITPLGDLETIEVVQPLTIKVKDDYIMGRNQVSCLLWAMRDLLEPRESVELRRKICNSRKKPDSNIFQLHG